MSTIFAFFHHAAAFALVGTLAAELVLVGQAIDNLTVATARRLLRIDAVYGAAAGILVIVGLCRVFFFEKGAVYYFSSPAFYAKMGAFILIGLISIAPTVEFMRWRKPVSDGVLPDVGTERLRRIRSLIHAELALIVVILLCAAAMARGGFV